MFKQYGSINPTLLDLAVTNLARFEKQAFVPGNDPMAQQMGGGAPPGGDPSGGGGAPPPAMDPSAGGGGGGGIDPAQLQAIVMPMIQQAMQQGGGGAGGGAGGAAGGIKPKIDVNVELMQIKNILAKIADALGVQIPAQDMVATPEKLQAMAGGGATTDPSGGQPAGGQGQSAIQPIQPMQAAAPGMGKQGNDKAEKWKQQGTAFDATGLNQTFNKAAAVSAMLNRRRTACST